MNGSSGEGKVLLTVEVQLKPESQADMAAVKAAALAYLGDLPAVRYAEGPLAAPQQHPPGWGAQHPLLEAAVRSMRVADLGGAVAPNKLLLQWDVEWQVGRPKALVLVCLYACLMEVGRPKAHVLDALLQQGLPVPHTKRCTVMLLPLLLLSPPLPLLPQVLVYQLDCEGPADDDEGGDEATPAYREWQLPAAEFDGCWEALVRAAVRVCGREDGCRGAQKHCSFE